MSFFNRIALLLLFIAPCGLPLFGQGGPGSITGEVLDASGASLPHANLRLVQAATGIAVTTLSNQEGLFAFPSVAVGEYSLTIKASGFKEQLLDHLSVNAFQQLSLGKITMVVGEGPAQSVTVSAEQEELGKDSGVRSDAIESRTVD